MEAKHSHPNCPKGTVDLVENIYNNDLPFTKNIWLAEVIWDDAMMASIYLHCIEGVILADTYLNSTRDSYAVITDGPAIFAYNIGRFPMTHFFLFDRDYYESLEDQFLKCQYVAYTCLGGDGLPEDTLVHLYDQRAKLRIDELHLSEIIR